MKATALIAANFVREQRWLFVGFLLWIFGSAAVFGAGSPAAEEVEFYVRQQAAYVVGISLFYAAGAVRAEQRSRRILAVLAKVVTRGEYLGGLLLGTLVLAAVYCACTGLAGGWLFAKLGVPLIGLWIAMARLFFVALLVAATALLFSTFLHPLLAVVGAAALLGAQVGVEHALGAGGAVTSLAQPILAFQLQSSYDIPWLGFVAALGESGVLWMLAARIFARRDITVAVEN